MEDMRQWRSIAFVIVHLETASLCPKMKKEKVLLESRIYDFRGLCSKCVEHQKARDHDESMTSAVM
uniref:Uncharacterized protein n=1 Tax=Parascaris univalens TaxID=6257 RepID=A0A915A7L5_PARUN